MEEVWKAIDGYEGLYEVSNTGKVRSLDRRIFAKPGSKTWKFVDIGGVIMKQKPNKDGYSCFLRFRGPYRKQ